MQSSNKQLPGTETLNTPVFQIPTEILLSLATGPFLLGIVGVQMLQEWLSAAGLASEEVFRGDRLPVLHFPNSEPSDTP